MPHAELEKQKKRKRKKNIKPVSITTNDEGYSYQHMSISACKYTVNHKGEYRKEKGITRKQQ
jgi:hypothetical protein